MKYSKRLTAEVASVESKRDAKKYRWDYPDYFFGRKPEVKSPGKKGQGRKVQ